MSDDNLARQKLAVREVFYEFFNNDQQLVAQKHFNYKFICRFNQYTLTGTVELIRLINLFHSHFPFTHIEVAAIFSEGDMVCAQWNMVLRSNKGQQILSTNGITTFKFRSEKIIQVEQQLNVATLHTAYKHAIQNQHIH